MLKKLFFILIILIFLVGAACQVAPTEEINVRVLLADSLETCEFSSSSGFILNYDNKEIKIPNLKLKIIVKAKGSSPLQILNENDEEILSLNDKIKILPQSEEDKLKFNNHGYRGYFIVLFKKDRFKVINYVKLNEYLYGVLPEELKTDIIEAGKFQAVISKNFVLGKLEKNKNKEFDTYGDTRDQVYGGYDVEVPKTNQEIDLIKNAELTYNGALAADVCYFSSCGGATVGNQDVFLNDPVPYSQSVECNLASFLDFLKKKDEKKFNKFKTGIENMIKEAKLKEPLCAYSKFYKWKVIVNKADILENLPSYSAERISEIESLKISSRDKYGRVTEIQIKGKNKNILLRGNRIRWILSFKKDNGAKQVLYSTNFDINSKGGGAYEIEGKGWGHGTGLCQTGALKLASLGASFEDILEFYYTGTRVSGKSDKAVEAVKE